MEKSDAVLGNKHLWGGGRMWRIMKEHLKSPEGARESMLRVKASLQGQSLGIFETFLIENYGVVLSTDRENTESAE